MASRSAPAQNAPPAPVRTTTRMSGSAFASSHAADMPSIISSDNAFRRSGRFIVTTRTCPSRSVSRCPCGPPCDMRGSRTHSRFPHNRPSGAERPPRPAGSAPPRSRGARVDVSRVPAPVRPPPAAARVRAGDVPRRLLLHRPRARAADLRRRHGAPRHGRPRARRAGVGGHLPQARTRLRRAAPEGAVGRPVVRAAAPGRQPEDRPPDAGERRQDLVRRQPARPRGRRRRRPGLVDRGLPLSPE